MPNVVAYRQKGLTKWEIAKLLDKSQDTIQRAMSAARDMGLLPGLAHRAKARRLEA